MTIKTRPVTPEYRGGYDRIFGAVQPRREVPEASMLAYLRGEPEERATTDTVTRAAKAMVH